MQIKNVDDVEDLHTSEGITKPLMFGEGPKVLHLGIPLGLNIRPHTHRNEPVTYCISNELEVASKEERNIARGAQ